MLSKIAAKLRALQMFYQSSHHHVKGASFAGDHGLFKDFYEEVAGDFDDVAERTIALEGPESLALPSLLQGVYADLDTAPSYNVKRNVELFAYGLTVEKKLNDACKELLDSPTTEGTRQLVGDIMNRMEARVYKIKQRMKE